VVPLLPSHPPDEMCLSWTGRGRQRAPLFSLAVYYSLDPDGPTRYTSDITNTCALRVGANVWKACRRIIVSNS
jgi:hypothetical protein